MTDPGPQPHVAAIVPAHDEEARVAATVDALRPIVSEVIVVDDGSTDSTAAEAERAGARVVRLETNRGKAAALEAGIDATNAPVLLFADGDLATSASNLRALLEPVLTGGADVAIAAPPRTAGPSGFGLVENLARAGIARAAGPRFDRPLSGQRAFKREVLAVTRPFAPRFGVETAFTIDALRAGYRVVEVPCAISHARTGRTAAGFVHRARQGLDVLRALVRRR